MKNFGIPSKEYNLYQTTVSGKVMAHATTIHMQMPRKMCFGLHLDFSSFSGAAIGWSVSKA
jgi:hypothetical protein